MNDPRSQNRVVTREELYSLVWERPASKLCKQFGISDRGLAKLCNRYRIPKPGLGYWRRKETGKTVIKPKLPEWGGTNPEIAEFTRTIRRSKAVAQAKTESLEVSVPKRLTRPHRLITEARKTLLNTFKSEDGFLRSWEPILNVRVTKGSLSRALRIMDTVIKELEGRGHRITIDATQYRTSTNVYIDGHSVSFGIAERQVQANKEPCRRAELAPTGLLYLDLIGAFNGHRGTWSDGKRQRVENLLGDFILEVESVGRARKKQHEERERERAIWEAERERVRLEKERIDQFHSLIENWKFAKEAQNFVSDVKQSSPRPEFATDQWLEWAVDYVDSLDNLMKLGGRFHARQ